MLKTHVAARFTALAASALALALTASAATPPAPHWVATWATSPVFASNTTGKFDAAAPDGITLRQIVHLSIGGSSFRIQFTNEFGTADLKISAASLATVGAAGALTSTAMPVTFGGHASVTIPAGAMMVSDPVSLKAAPLSDVAVSLFLPSQTIDAMTLHSFADTTSYRVPGNSVTAPALTDPKTFTTWMFLKGIAADAPANAASIVTLGDSITDGALSTRDTNHRWPDVLAARLQANAATRNLGIANEGIGGNRVLHDTTGPNMLARFDRDVIAQPGVKYLVVMEAINDIGHSFDPSKPYDPITADELIVGYKQLIERAHEHGIKVFGATLTPYVGAKYQSPAGEAARQAVNEFIRHGGAFDGVIDFDQVTRDPANPGAFLPAYDSGDHLHPKDAGYKAMGESIDLKLFR
ncbi:Lysophospholipase L1 [Bryocella elongata]|uniref:Lysophospholipase L1 n=2 Tax=Bryocella elongata TaxID=863522 RepID=A0A1H5W3T5_9BACT|nr:Lysophospholipase L1 [Bryocella elongata]